jgi:hypothetical protein
MQLPPVLVGGSVPAELAVLGAFHVVFLVRVVMARRAAARQRAATCRDSSS